MASPLPTENVLLLLWITALYIIYLINVQKYWPSAWFQVSVHLLINAQTRCQCVAYGPSCVEKRIENWEEFLSHMFILDFGGQTIDIFLPIQRPIKFRFILTSNNINMWLILIITDIVIILFGFKEISMALCFKLVLKYLKF